jgi:polyferredoxin
MVREEGYMNGLAENIIRQPVKESAKQGRERAFRSRFIKQAIFGSMFIALVIAGWSYSLIGYFIPLCMAAGVGLAAFRGRTWCNWMCPRGSFADTYMKAISPGRAIPSAFRKVPIRLGVLAFLMAMLAFQVMRLWPDGYAIGRFFITLLTVTTVIGTLLAMFFHQRAWCSICPIGSLSSWVGINRRTLKIDRDSCITCGLCAKNCPMQLKPVDMKKMPAMKFKGDCLKCELCVKVCPKQALKF